MSLKDRLEGNSEAWRPDDETLGHPNPLTGWVTEVTTGTGDFGEYPLLFVLDDDKNEWRVHGFGTVLKSRIAELKPEPGDEIGIRFLGLVKSKGFDTPYRNYKLVLEKAQGTKAAGPDWEAMAAAAKAEAEEQF